MSKLVNFCVAILILKIHSQHIMLYYFKKGKIPTETHKKDLYSVWRRCCDSLNVSKVVCKVSCWRFLGGWCSWSGRPIEVDSDQIETLRTTMLYHMGDSRHTQNIQINKVLVKMKNVSFVLWKKIWTFWPTQCHYIAKVHLQILPIF